MSDRFLRKDIWSIVLVTVGSIAVCIGVILALTEEAISRQRHDILDQKTITASAIASRFQLRIEGSVQILQFVANSGLFADLKNPEALSPDFNGIPIGLEEEKRKILRDTHTNYDIFDTVHFMLPNGDIYMLEPYERQLSLPRMNYADREYYQGAIASGSPYVSNVIISTASKQRVLPIAFPAFDSEGKLTGLVVGATDLQLLEAQLRKELNLSDNHRIVFVDENASVIEDIAKTSVDPYTSLVSFDSLKSVQNVLDGKSGSTVETLDNTEMLIVYQPIAIHGHQWGVLVMQPTSDAYSAIDFLRNQSYVMLAIIVSILGLTGYFLASLRARSALAAELSKTNMELVKKDKLKDEFLRLASHELRTPIQPILGYSSLAKSGMVDQNMAWEIVHTEAQKLMNLSNNIIDVSMIQSGSMGLAPEKITIGDVLTPAVDSVRPAARKKGLTLDLSIDEACLGQILNVDKSRLTRVFIELLTNAIKFTEQGGIAVQCRLDKSPLVVTVKDSGTSIEEEMMPRIFDIFTSASYADAKIQGAGLGLFVCKAILKAHGGAIRASNNVDGPGATFEVSLPLSAHTSNGAAAN